MNKTDNHTTYIQGLQADIDKLKASLPTITDDYKKTPVRKVYQSTRRRETGM